MILKNPTAGDWVRWIQAYFETC